MVIFAWKVDEDISTLSRWSRVDTFAWPLVIWGYDKGSRNEIEEEFKEKTHPGPGQHYQL